MEGSEDKARIWKELSLGGHKWKEVRVNMKIKVRVRPDDGRS